MEEYKRILTNAASILDTAMIALDHTLCDRCLGRQFGKAGYGLSNEERGKAIRIVMALSHELLSETEQGEVLPVSWGLPIHPSGRSDVSTVDEPRKDDEWNLTGTPSMDSYLQDGKDDGKCWLCQDVFDSVDELSQLVLESSKEQEFKTFVIGCRMDPGTLERERILWEKIAPTSAEPLKEEINREIGKRYSDLEPDKDFDRNNPEVAFIVDPLFKTVEVSIKPVFIKGRYRKLQRGIPQTRWICKDCRGKGCDRCDGRGKMYETSVEEIIGERISESLKGSDYKLHGMGREDVDVLTLGRGRPFVLEISSPRIRTFDIGSIAAIINEEGSGKVEVLELEPSERREVAHVKDGASLKRYRARISLEGDIDEETLKYNISLLAQSPINQRTPWRVSHRRADKVRVRKVHEASVSLEEDGGVLVNLLTDGGLYIKELLHGDRGRTEPSLSSLLGVGVNVERLDVMDVLDDAGSRMDQG
ncbi:MAG: tRNA pseudouridine(54/55) synthase Pus10 [Thermoplasmatota archaeon]